MNGPGMIGWLIVHPEVASWLLFLASTAAFLLGLTWHSRQHPPPPSFRTLQPDRELIIRTTSRYPDSLDP